MFNAVGEAKYVYFYCLGVVLEVIVLTVILQAPPGPGPARHHHRSSIPLAVRE
jgi:hypothetical protein